jgi:hypothetical protein
VAGGSLAVVKMYAPRAAGGSSSCEARSLCDDEPVRRCSGLVLKPFRCNLPLSAYLLLDPGSNRAESGPLPQKTPYRSRIRTIRGHSERQSGQELPMAPARARSVTTRQRSVAGSAEPVWWRASRSLPAPTRAHFPTMPSS